MYFFIFFAIFVLPTQIFGNSFVVKLHIPESTYSTTTITCKSASDTSLVIAWHFEPRALQPELATVSWAPALSRRRHDMTTTISDRDTKHLTIYNLESSTSYWISLKLTNSTFSDFGKNFTNFIYCDTLEKQLSVVANLTCSDINDHSLIINWDSVQEFSPNAFNISWFPLLSRIPNESKTLTLRHKGTSHLLQISNLLPAVSYGISIKSISLIDRSLDSDVSQILQCKTTFLGKIVRPLFPPLSVNCSVVSDSKIFVKWSGVPRAVKYNVRWFSEFDENQSANWSSPTEFMLVRLSPSTNYTVEVRSLSGVVGTNSIYSQPVYCLTEDRRIFIVTFNFSFGEEIGKALGTRLDAELLKVLDYSFQSLYPKIVIKFLTPIKKVFAVSPRKEVESLNISFLNSLLKDGIEWQNTLKLVVSYDIHEKLDTHFFDAQHNSHRDAMQEQFNGSTTMAGGVIESTHSNGQTPIADLKTSQNIIFVDNSTSLPSSGSDHVSTTKQGVEDLTANSATHAIMNSLNTSNFSGTSAPKTGLFSAIPFYNATISSSISSSPNATISLLTSSNITTSSSVSSAKTINYFSATPANSTISSSILSSSHNTEDSTTQITTSISPRATVRSVTLPITSNLSTSSPIPAISKTVNEI